MFHFKNQILYKPTPDYNFADLSSGQCELGQLHYGTPLDSRLVSAYTYTGPVSARHGVRPGIPVIDQR
jgi:hypothetical protein